MRLPAPFALALALVAALVLTACIGISETITISPTGSIAVNGAFSRAAPKDGTGGAFMTITNNGSQADQLLSAASNASQMVELHETFDDNGVMKMRAQPQGFEIPAHGKLELKPGGKHIMLMGLASALEPGKDIEVTLLFEKAGPVKVVVPVRAP
jgi:periplasmic copper chaperone A